MKERAKEFKEILEFAKSKGYSKESAESLQEKKGKNIIILFLFQYLHTILINWLK